MKRRGSNDKKTSGDKMKSLMMLVNLTNIDILEHKCNKNIAYTSNVKVEICKLNQ